MKFCPIDSSMLTPASFDRKLHYKCKLCDYRVSAESDLIYRNRLVQAPSSLLTSLPPSLHLDPTLSRTYSGDECEECGSREAVFFQCEVKGRESLPLVFCCAGCGHKWVK